MHKYDFPFTRGLFTWESNRRNKKNNNHLLFKYLYKYVFIEHFQNKKYFNTKIMHNFLQKGRKKSLDDIITIN